VPRTKSEGLTKSIGIRATPDLKRRLGRYLSDTDQSKQAFLTALIESTLKKAGYGLDQKRGA